MRPPACCAATWAHPAPLALHTWRCHVPVKKRCTGALFSAPFVCSLRMTRSCTHGPIKHKTRCGPHRSLRKTQKPYLEVEEGQAAHVPHALHMAGEVTHKLHNVICMVQAGACKHTYVHMPRGIRLLPAPCCYSAPPTCMDVNEPHTRCTPHEMHMRMMQPSLVL